MFFSDHVLTSLAQDIFKVIATTPGSSDSLESRLVPTLGLFKNLYDNNSLLYLVLKLWYVFWRVISSHSLIIFKKQEKLDFQTNAPQILFYILQKTCTKNQRKMCWNVCQIFFSSEFLMCFLCYYSLNFGCGGWQSLNEFASCGLRYFANFGSRLCS